MQKNIDQWFNTLPNRRQSDSDKWGHYPQDVLPMWVADADYAAPESVITAIQSRLSHPVLGYGLIPHRLKESIVAHLNTQFNWEIDADWITFSPGVVGSLNASRAIMGEVGSQAITALPVYPHLKKASPILERPMQFFSMRNEKCGDAMRYVPDFDELEANITSQTKMLILCNPHNPVGRAYTQKELMRFAEIALKHDLLICSDDIHADFTLYEETPYYPIADLSNEIAQRSITLMAASKTFNIAGLNCSYAIIPNASIRKKFEHQTSGLLGGVNILGYVASEAAYADNSGWYEAQKIHIKQQAEYCYQKINAIANLKMNPMEATYLAWVDASAYHQKLKEKGFNYIDEYLLTHKVAVSSGRYFGDKDYFRINLATSDKLLDKGLTQIAKGFEQLNT